MILKNNKTNETDVRDLTFECTKEFRDFKIGDIIHVTNYYYPISKELPINYPFHRDGLEEDNTEWINRTDLVEHFKIK